jgi:predicted aminopeptidase
MKSRSNTLFNRPALWVATVTILVALPALQLAGCAGPGYYAQAVSGHMGLMGQRQDVTELMQNAQTDPELMQKLARASAARDFAINRLLLPDDGSYTDFVQTGKEAVVWNVVAAPEFSLIPKQWCFIVSGCVSYRGYFKQDDAGKFADRLERKGYDVAVSPAIAYSTLGWFDDPLLDTMFRYDEVQLSAFVFHELAHSKLYVKGDTAFNEAYANAVELIGVRMWLESRPESEELDRWMAMQSAARDLNQLLQSTRLELKDIYNPDSGNMGNDQGKGDEISMRELKSIALDDFRKEYLSLVNQKWQGHDYFGAWFQRPLNNASLALMNSYQGGECAFSEMWDQSGYDIQRFHSLARAMAGKPGEDRRKWLDKPC